MNQTKFVLLSLLFLSSIILSFILVITKGNISRIETPFVLVFSDEIEAVLEEKEHLLTEYLNNPTVFKSLQTESLNNESLSLKTISKIDEEWQKGDSENTFPQSIIDSELSDFLRIFQEENAGYAEIFITDTRGINIAMTNMTSDYYQADEEWWVDTYANGQGFAHHGNIEYDDSSGVDGVAFYFPITDPNSGEVIGVVKTIIDTLSIIYHTGTTMNAHGH